MNDYIDRQLEALGLRRAIPEEPGFWQLVDTEDGMTNVWVMPTKDDKP